MFAINSFMSLAYAGATVFFLLVVLRLTVPYSNNLLKLLHRWSQKTVVKIGLFVAALFWMLLVLFLEGTETSRYTDVYGIIVQSLVSLLIVFIIWGVVLAFMRFSYIYLVDEEKNK